LNVITLKINADKVVNALQLLTINEHQTRAKPQFFLRSFA